MLLDQLLEKKDVILYLKLRADFLREIKHRETIKEPLENREFIVKKLIQEDVKTSGADRRKFLHAMSKGFVP